MSTMTAQILIGKAHPYDGGINPNFTMFLSENSVACWTLIKLNFRETVQPTNPIVVKWIPTIEFMLEDAVMMIGLYVLKDVELIHLAKEHIRTYPGDKIDLYSDASEEGLKEMRARAKQLTNHYKMTLSIFFDSTINRQYKSLKDYKMDIEVCLPAYAREYSVWSKKVEERGELG